MKKQNLIFFIFLFYLSFSNVFAGDNKIKVSEPVKLIYGHVMEPEAVALSPDGEQLTFRAKGTKFEKGDSHTVFLGKLGVDGVWSGPTRFKASYLYRFFAYAGFSSDGSALVVSTDEWRPFGLTKTAMSIGSKTGFDVKGYAHYIRIYDLTSKKIIETISYKTLKIKRGDRMEHVRMSPNGQWLTFYLHDIPEQRGVYLYHLKTKKTYHLGLFDDKHPTWSADGSKLVFHTQKGGNAEEESDVEMASIGYYDLKFIGDSVTFIRHLLDAPLASGEYRYHKHPALYPGTNMLFFHGKKKPDGASKIYVRDLSEKSKVFELELKNEEALELKSAKHPGVSNVDSGLFFIGKYKDETDEVYGKHIFYLNPSAIAEIAQKILKAK